MAFHHEAKTLRQGHVEDCHRGFGTLVCVDLLNLHVCNAEARVQGIQTSQCLHIATILGEVSGQDNNILGPDDTVGEKLLREVHGKDCHRGFASLECVDTSDLHFIKAKFSV